MDSPGKSASSKERNTKPGLLTLSDVSQRKVKMDTSPADGATPAKLPRIDDNLDVDGEWVPWTLLCRDCLRKLVKTDFFKLEDDTKFVVSTLFPCRSCREKCVRFLKAQREVMQLEELSPDGNVVNSIDNGNNDPQNPHAGSEGLQGSGSATNEPSKQSSEDEWKNFMDQLNLAVSNNTPVEDREMLSICIVQAKPGFELLTSIFELDASDICPIKTDPDSLGKQGKDKSTNVKELVGGFQAFLDQLKVAINIVPVKEKEKLLDTIEHSKPGFELLSSIFHQVASKICPPER